jgi:hypothetical protein
MNLVQTIEETCLPAGRFLVFVPLKLHYARNDDKDELSNP